MDAVGHLPRDRDGKHTSPKGHPAYQVPGPIIYLPLGEVMDGVHHRRYSAVEHVRESVEQGIGMGVHHVRPKVFHDAGDPRKHQRVEASLLAQEPHGYSVVREGFLCVRAQRAA